MINNPYTTAGTELYYDDSEDILGTEIDETTLLFEYFFSVENPIRDKNSLLINYIERLTQEGNFDLINSLINNDAIFDLHISLLKSALLMTENLNNYRVDSEKLLKAYNLKTK